MMTASVPLIPPRLTRSSINFSPLTALRSFCRDHDKTAVSPKRCEGDQEYRPGRKVRRLRDARRASTAD